jgi:hypothetical protein
MIDLKPYYDNVLNTQAAVQAILNEIDAAIKLGTPEGEEQALAMEPKLDAATAKAEAAQKFYDKVLNASKTSDVAVNFVPVSNTPNTPEEETPKGTMVRKDFQALNPAARVDFLKANGKVVDE